jgi:hypothetical protein
LRRSDRNNVVKPNAARGRAIEGEKGAIMSGGERMRNDFPNITKAPSTSKPPTPQHNSTNRPNDREHAHRPTVQIPNHQLHQLTTDLIKKWACSRSFGRFVELCCGVGGLDVDGALVIFGKSFRILSPPLMIAPFSPSMARPLAALGLTTLFLSERLNVPQIWVSGVYSDLSFENTIWVWFRFVLG